HSQCKMRRGRKAPPRHGKPKAKALVEDRFSFHVGLKEAWLAAMRHPGAMIKAYGDGVLAGDRTMLARAITLVESAKDEHRGLAQELLQRLLPATGKAHRIAITGVPGVGKSTAIDQLGINLLEQGHRVAVLAVDPSSTRSGGSILGDKTRMVRLAQSR